MTTNNKAYLIKDNRAYAIATDKEIKGIIDVIVKRIIFEKDHNYRKSIAGTIWYGIIRPGESIDQMHDDACNSAKFRPLYDAYVDMFIRSREHYLKLIRTKNIVIRMIRGLIFGLDLSKIYYTIPQNS